MLCSLVLLAWNRPDNVNTIIQQYAGYACVGEIIVWNNNKHRFVSDLGLDKVKVINCSADCGLNSRFVAASMCLNDCVLVHDDDLLMSEANIQNLMNHFKKDYSRIYTYEGRNLLNGQYVYTFEGDARLERVSSPVEATITLTRAACFERKYASRYMEMQATLFYDTELNLNGEDIVFSYLVAHLSSKKPMVLPLKDPAGYTDLPITEKISTRPQHLERRTELAQRCELVLPRPAFTIDESAFVLNAATSGTGYLSNSRLLNSEFAHVLIKSVNGIKYFSIPFVDQYSFCLANYNTAFPIARHQSLLLRYFFVGIVSSRVEMQFVYEDETRQERESPRVKLRTAGLKCHLINSQKIDMTSLVPKEAGNQLSIKRVMWFLHGKHTGEFCFTSLGVS